MVDLQQVPDRLPDPDRVGEAAGAHDLVGAEERSLPQPAGQLVGRGERVGPGFEVPRVHELAYETKLTLIHVSITSYNAYKVTRVTSY